MARVTGIGGVFFKSTSDHKRLAAWYRDNLGLALEEWGGIADHTTPRLPLVGGQCSPYVLFFEIASTVYSTR